MAANVLCFPREPSRGGLWLKWFGIALWVVLLTAGRFGLAEVEFPGPAPGKAECSFAGGALTLENGVISVSWQVAKGRLQPLQLINKLTGKSFDQRGAELFRLALSAQAEQKGIVVAIRLESERVKVLASRDGSAWTEIAHFSRSEFAGEPKLVRLGKMNLQAQAKDYVADLGAPGCCVLGEFNLSKGLNSPSRFELKAKAHQAAVHEYPFPPGTKLVSCRIDKGTDQGMSWAPGLALIWEDGKRFMLVGLRDAKPVFNVTTAEGESIIDGTFEDYPAMDLAASAFELVRPPSQVRLTAAPTGIRVADRMGGVALETELSGPREIRARWRAELRDGSGYVRQTIQFFARDKIPLFGVELADVRLGEAKTIGSVPGCPVVGSGIFLGVEMPGAQNRLSDKGARVGLGCRLELSETQSYTFSGVIGVVPGDQLRRAFLCYVERERARPSSPFLHYNCWYDLGFSVDADSIVDVVDRFNQELVGKRGVRVQSFLVDDGWDDPGRGLWVESFTKFPNGLAALKSRMAKADANLAIWISPLGGYGGQEERTAQAQKLGLIPEGGKLDLAYPRYKSWFQDRCLQLMREAGVNAFKWDRAGEGVTPHFMALLDIAQTLRQQNPNVFINVTVGTWPSPFWLNHVDSTWRNGSADVGWSGKGDDREQWMTFRDGECRRLFVVASPLYPLNSVMHHGIVHGRHFQGERVGKSGPDLKNEVRSFFANGTSLQELYLTPAMMTSGAWDCLAEGAKWAQANAAVLVDSHWVGGDPLKLEPYGYAAWSPRKATLMVRNPDAKPQAITLDARRVFELPAAAAKSYALQAPYRDQRVQHFSLEVGRPQLLSLQPFEVLVFDARPAD